MKTNSKGFIILYKGRIVLERYFNNHSASKTWYWASAGKTLIAATNGIAEERGFIDYFNKSFRLLRNWMD